MDSQKKRKIISVICILVFVTIMMLLAYSVREKLGGFINDPQSFRTWIEEKGFPGKLLFVGLVAFQVIVAVIPGEPFELGAGYAFGIIQGTLLCMIGILIGSTIVFVFVRKLGYKAIEAFFPIEKIRQMEWMKNTRKLEATAFILFFIPGTPKDIMTYFIGLTPMKLSRWILISFTARIPSILTSTISGSKLMEKDYVTALIVFGVTLVLAACGAFFYNKLNEKKTREQAATTQDPDPTESKKDQQR